MSTALGLAMQISANTAQLAASIKDVNAKLDSMATAGKKAASDLSVLKTIELSKVFAAAVVSTAQSFSSFVAGSAAAVASVDDLSKRTGVSTQTLQAYQFAAEQSGVSTEAFGKGIQKLGINLGEAQTGNKTAIKSFEDLGLSVTELSRLSPEAAFEKVAAAISQLPNPAQQAAAAVGLFGKSGAELVPVFQEGAGYLSEMRAEAERLGLVLNKDQVQGLATLDDSIQKVSASFKAFGARVVAELAPQLIAAAESAATFVASIQVGDVADAASAALGGLVDVAEAAGSAFLIVYQSTAPLAKTILPVIADTLSFIATNFRGVAAGALAAAGGLAGYALASLSAAKAVALLTAAQTALLSSTGIGVLVVAFGALTGALVSYAVSAGAANTQAAQGFEQAQAAVNATFGEVEKATESVKRFGAEARIAFKLPAEITDQTLLQGTVDQATQAFRKFAQEAGNLSAVPKDVADAYESLQTAVDNVNRNVIDQAVGQELIADAAAEVLGIIKQSTEARDKEKKAIEESAAAAKKAKEDAQKRVADLVPGAGDAGRELFDQISAIQNGVAAAERTLADARANGDAQAIADAKERLRLAQEMAKAATDAAAPAKVNAIEAPGGMDTSAAQASKLESEKSRIKLMQDLAAIQSTIDEAEKQAVEARAAGDSAAIAAAEERLRITVATAEAASKAAKQQAKDRELAALGIEKSLLKPVQTVKDEFLKVRKAYDAGLINDTEARNALENIAKEGVKIRKDIAMELSQPSGKALQAADLRSSEGISQFMALATGREDPAVGQLRQQLAKLEEIRQGLEAVGANPVEILGAS